MGGYEKTDINTAILPWSLKMNFCLTCALEWVQVTTWKNTRISKNFLSPVVFLSTIWTLLPPPPSNICLQLNEAEVWLRQKWHCQCLSYFTDVYAHCSYKVIFQLIVLLWASRSRINLLATRVTHPKHGSGATGINIEMLLQIS